jgi:hypothetical protein
MFFTIYFDKRGGSLLKQQENGMLNSRESSAAPASAHRRHPRHHLATPLNLWRRRGTGTMIPGIALEISLSGISVILPDELILGEEVEVQVMLPAGQLRLTAVVRNRNMFRYGFEFQSPTAAEMQLIRETCAALPLYADPE